MCLTCNPYCGRCRPPARKAVRCPFCGHDNGFSREECLIYLGLRKGKNKENVLTHGIAHPQCEQCEKDIGGALKEKVVALQCHYMELVCGYPCGRHAKPKRVGDLDCVKLVPVKGALYNP